MNKAAASVWPLKVTYRLEDAQGHTDALVVDVANPQSAGLSDGAPWLKVDLRRDVTGADAKVQRGLISLMQMTAGAAQAMPVLPAKGVALQVVVPTLELDVWQALGKSFQAERQGACLGRRGGGYVPDSMLIKTGTLSYQQRHLRDVSATVAHPAQGFGARNWMRGRSVGKLSGCLTLLPVRAGSAG